MIGLLMQRQSYWSLLLVHMLALEERRQSSILQHCQIELTDVSGKPAFDISEEVRLCLGIPGK